ncbi:helix-turn-helix transcriptional regulator [uncultured Phascolarctobacterium sp.]|uniref:helix-turn-helix domain-containing protein n=1 Tax=uncultured Phascolarctobacterium sp. TaxID=512296 RepID=UPI0025F36DE1|nr:helix-turn-helix transcriptional regulator [uncultured Phascolarctobacterium sp.]
MYTEREILLAVLRKEIGEVIVDQRRRKGLTQAKLAAMCGISKRLLIGIENGYASYSMDKYLLMSIALDMGMEEVLGMAAANLAANKDSRERLEVRIRQERQAMQNRLSGEKENCLR